MPDWRDPRVAVNAFVAFWFLVVFGWVVPNAYFSQATIRGLQPQRVRRITLASSALALMNKQPPLFVLTSDQALEFVRLLADSSYRFPNHPKARWTRFVQIETADATHHLSISATTNNGTIVWICNETYSGSGPGVLRNDALEPLLNRIFAAATPRSGPK